MSERSENNDIITHGGRGHNRRGRGRGRESGSGCGRGRHDIRTIHSAPASFNNDHTLDDGDPIIGVSNPSPDPINSSTPHIIPSAHDSSHLPSSQEQSPVSKLKIEPCGNEFFPHKTVSKVSTIIKNKYDEPWTDWSHIPGNVKKMWFEEFRKVCQWDPANHKAIVCIFKRKGAQVVRQSLGDIRRDKVEGKWLTKRVLQALEEKWETDRKFKEMSKRNKKNISNNVGRVNRSGSVSVTEHMRRYEKEMGREVSIPELFQKMNYDKSKDKWSNSHAESTYDAFCKLKDIKVSKGEEVNDTTLFLEANGGIDKKGRSYGLGSEAAFYASTSRSTSISRAGCSQTNSTQVIELQTRLGLMEEKNNELEANLSLVLGKNQNLQASVDQMKSKLDSVIGLLEKFTGSPFANSSSDRLSPSNIQHMQSVNEDNDIDKDMANDDNDDDDGYDDGYDDDERESEGDGNDDEQW